MSAGTLTLTNKSDAVTGIGTTFTTDLNAGDFIVAVIGGVTYTLPVKTIESETTLTLSRNHSGPTQSALAWTAMPRDTLNRISGQIAADTAYAIRSRVLEIDNWYQLLEVNGDVTIKMSDGSEYSGPSWRKIIDIANVSDFSKIEPLAQQISDDARQVASDKTDAANSKTAAAQSESDAKARADASKVEADRAKASADDSAASAEAAESAEGRAKREADRAKEEADRASESNPANYLVRAFNLSDVEDKAAALATLIDSKPVPLGGDPVNPYDATTKRWVENIIGQGTVGPTMNGVMNFGVGAVRHNTSRAYIAPYEVAADGQLLNRADWPELWVHAKLHGTVTDSIWLSDPSKRGKYSDGDGSTTFRAPDLNGVQADSISSLYLRGDGGASSQDGLVVLSGIPNIKGEVRGRTVGTDGAIFNNGSGALLGNNPASTLNQIPSGSTTGSVLPDRMVAVTFDASRSSPIYGRTATELRPNTAIGVWVIRASGGFVAANTTWSVINGDDSTPATGTTVKGGSVQSVYKVGQTTNTTVSFHSSAQFGADGAVIKSAIIDIDGVKQFKFTADGGIDAGFINSVENKDKTLEAIGAFRFDPKQGIAGQSANNFNGNVPGIFQQPSNAQATSALGFPTPAAGSLVVIPNAANGPAGCTQLYYPYEGYRGIWFRRFNASTSAWDPYWSEFLTSNGHIVGGSTPTTGHYNSIEPNSVAFGYGGSDTGGPGWAGPVLSYSHARFRQYKTQISTAYSSYGRMAFRSYNADSAQVWQPWREIWSTGNTTVDANGFIKRASPIVKIFTDGTFELNEESEGCNVSKMSEGVYKITGCLGLSSDAAWGGPDGGIEAPVDINKQPLLWLNYTVDVDGSVIIETYHRENKSSPPFARNIRQGYEDGQAIDIPANTFLSVRVEMPEDSAFNVRLKKEEEDIAKLMASEE